MEQRRKWEEMGVDQKKKNGVGRKKGKRKQTKTGIKFLRNVLRVLRSIIGPEARGNWDRSSPQAGKRERFTCTFYLDVCQTRQLQSDHEREKERQ